MGWVSRFCDEITNLETPGRPSIEDCSELRSFPCSCCPTSRLDSLHLLTHSSETLCRLSLLLTSSTETGKYEKWKLRLKFSPRNCCKRLRNAVVDVYFQWTFSYFLRACSQQTIVHNRNQFMLASLGMSPWKLAWRDWKSRRAQSLMTDCEFFSDFPNEIFSVWFEIRWLMEVLPAVALRIRSTHRCWRNSTTSNIDRRRTWKFSYWLEIWPMRWAADWSIVSAVIGLWQVFGIGMRPTFWAVTFFMRWKIHELFHVPENEREMLLIYSDFNRKSLHNINEDGKSPAQRTEKLCRENDADNFIIKFTICEHSVSVAYPLVYHVRLESALEFQLQTRHTALSISHHNLNFNHILFMLAQAAPSSPNAQQNQLEIPAKPFWFQFDFQFHQKFNDSPKNILSQLDASSPPLGRGERLENRRSFQRVEL